MAALQSIVVSCLVAFLIFNSGDSASAVGHEARIVGGTQTSIDRLPYIVQLRTKDDDHFCGATLVTPRYVISAAHCFVKISYTQTTVVGGANTRTDPGVRRRIVRFVRHPEYSPTSYHSDIVVLKLDADMVGRNIKPIPLCQRALKTGDYLEISGWGQTGTNDPMSHYLRTVRAPVISTQTCKETYGRFVQRNMVCAYLPGSKSSCGGDSGGPAVANGQLCGVVAFGMECASEKYAGAYTDVYAVRGFIENVMRY